MRLIGRYSNSQRETKQVQDLMKRAHREHVERIPSEPRARIIRLTKPTEDEILARYQRGERPVDLAREYGISEWRVQDLRKRSGVPRQDRSMVTSEIARALKLHAEGLSFNQIGAALKRDPKTVAKEIRLRTGG